jgi:threonylcarbamoyladenosine tRNA methylthiotransferase MtaB
MTSFAIQNFGCRVNQAEAFSWAETFERQGLKLEDEATAADLVVVNTCTLTSRADRDVRKFIRRISRLNPRAKLVITGCSVDGRRSDFEGIPQVSLVVSNDEKYQLESRVLAQVVAAPGASSKPLRSRGLLKVQDGCNLRCTFCIIPQVRGRSRSVGPHDLSARARELTARGFREIVLCGIHLSSYGLDLEPRSSLFQLLQELAGPKLTGRLRLSSLDPRYLDDELVDFIAASPKISPHFHLSLQHVSDRVLERMGRGSRAAEYRRILERLRRLSPDAALGADIIVGFPGETEADFAELEEFVRNSPLTYLHVFAFSPRPNTAAAGWPQVKEADKRRRSQLLRELSAEMRRRFRVAFLGREMEGIVIRRKDGDAEILTANFIDVCVPACSLGPGEAVRVKIGGIGPGITRGSIVI